MFPFRKGTMRSLIAMRYVIILLIIIYFYMGVVNGNITLVGRNPSLSFNDGKAIFGMSLPFCFFQFSYFIQSDSYLVEDSYCNYNRNSCWLVCNGNYFKLLNW
jgi:hypothetical protein